MIEKLEVDGFEIDIETLDNATRIQHNASLCRRLLLIEVLKNLTTDSKRRFEEYQEQNNPCK